MDHHLVLFEVSFLFQDGYGSLNGILDLFHGLHVKRIDVVYQGQFVHQLPVVGEGEDPGLGAVAGDVEGCGARIGEGDDGFGVGLFGHLAGIVADRFGQERGGELHGRMLLDIVKAVSFGPADDAVHVGHHPHGVFAYGGLAAEHEAVAAVEHGVGHIGSLGARGAEVLDHALHHLRGDDHRLGLLDAFLDDLLLDDRHLAERDLHAQVAAGDHDAFGEVDDLVEVLQRLRLFDLGDDPWLVAAAVFFDEIVQVEHIFRFADKREGDPVDLLLQDETGIFQVFLRQTGQGDGCMRQVDTLVGGEGAAVDHAGDHRIRTVGLGHLQLDLAVVDEHSIALFHIPGKLFVAHIHPFLVALTLGVGDLYQLSVTEHYGALFDPADAQLGPLQVGEDTHGDAHLFPQLFDDPYLFGLLFMGAVGEIETENIDPFAHHFFHGVGIVAGRPQRGDDLGLFQQVFVHDGRKFRDDGWRGKDNTTG